MLCLAASSEDRSGQGRQQRRQQRRHSSGGCKGDSRRVGHRLRPAGPVGERELIELSASPPVYPPASARSVDDAGCRILIPRPGFVLARWASSPSSQKGVQRIVPSRPGDGWMFHSLNLHFSDVFDEKWKIGRLTRWRHDDVMNLL